MEESDSSLGEFELELHRCIWKECKGDLVELHAYSSFNWITADYRCTKCGREFTVKIET